MIYLGDILRICKHPQGKGYSIEFSDGRSIHLTKRRTIIALLVLIHYGEGTEADLAKGSTRIPEIKKILGDRLPSGFINDYYGDANKPFSELWNEEGFTFIDNLKGERRGLSQCYVLAPSDHAKLFNQVRKAYRQGPSPEGADSIRIKQGHRCNLCGSPLITKSALTSATFAKDRRREVFDHRVPVQRGGSSADLNNYQALCFYCNKSKWQICNICDIPSCHTRCVLAFPETNNIIMPTGEDISILIPTSWRSSLQ